MFKNISSAIKISLIYFIFSILWIYFSDYAINFFVNDLGKLQFLQTIKGWLFVTTSSILLYILSKQLFSNLQEEKEKLATTNNILEKVIDNAPVIIFWKDKDGVYQGANKQILEVMNLKSKEELIGKKDSDFNISEKEDFVNDDIFVMTNKKAKLNYIETITTKNENIKILNSSKVPLFDNKGNVIGILGVVQDITEQTSILNQIKAQEKLIIQQSKLASMGEMINENAQYLSQTIDDFKNFFKKSYIKKTVNTNDLIEMTLKLIFSRLKNRDIEIIQNYESIEIDIYESEIIQVFINIINNSIDAFETINTEKYIFIDAKKIDNNLIIEIKDNAGGIQDNIINRIFEPYFTTKNEKQGTGIGLYMCNEIITKHLEGTISAATVKYNYLNKNYIGSIFTIILPI